MIEQKAKVLVVDDDELNRKLFGSILRESGYHVFEAANGEQAIFMIQKEAPSLVLLDIFLPGLNGAEVLSICREKGLLNRTKVFALTGSDPDRVLVEGFDGVIRKPVKVLDFLEVVGKALTVDNNKEDGH